LRKRVIICLQAHLNHPVAQILDIFAHGDWVAAWRTATLTTKEGTTAPSLVLIDVWHVKAGKVGRLQACTDYGPSCAS
jgi:hypothetical protein